MSVALNARAFKTATVRPERRPIVIRPEYLQIGGDIRVGALLSQIVYWSEPDHTGRTKLRVRRDGVYWIAKSRQEWMHETGLTLEQYKRAVAVLKRRGLIEVRVMRFDGLAIGHTRLIPEALQDALGGKPTSPMVGNPPTGWGETHQPSTETTSEITSRRKIVPLVASNTPTVKRIAPAFSPSSKQVHTPPPIVVMPFGEHKGKPLADVPQKYLRWLLNRPDLKSGIRLALEAEDTRRGDNPGGRQIPNADETRAYLDEGNTIARRCEAVRKWVSEHPDQHQQPGEDFFEWKARSGKAYGQAHTPVSLCAVPPQTEATAAHFAARPPSQCRSRADAEQHAHGCAVESTPVGERTSPSH
jgi:hypothetical protein